MCQNGELNRYLKTTRKRLTENEGTPSCYETVSSSFGLGTCFMYAIAWKPVRFILFVFAARRIFREVVQGLLYLHSHKILHRDLSLSNLLLTRTMDAVRARLHIQHNSSQYSDSLCSIKYCRCYVAENCRFWFGSSTEEG